MRGEPATSRGQRRKVFGDRPPARGRPPKSKPVAPVRSARRTQDGRERRGRAPKISAKTRGPTPDRRREPPGPRVRFPSRTTVAANRDLATDDGHSHPAASNRAHRWLTEIDDPHGSARRRIGFEGRTSSRAASAAARVPRFSLHAYRGVIRIGIILASGGGRRDRISGSATRSVARSTAWWPWSAAPSRTDNGPTTAPSRPKITDRLGQPDSGARRRAGGGAARGALRGRSRRSAGPAHRRLGELAHGDASGGRQGASRKLRCAPTSRCPSAA